MHKMTTRWMCKLKFAVVAFGFAPGRQLLGYGERMLKKCPAFVGVAFGY